MGGDADAPTCRHDHVSGCIQGRSAASCAAVCGPWHGGWWTPHPDTQGRAAASRGAAGLHDIARWPGHGASMSWQGLQAGRTARVDIHRCKRPDEPGVGGCEALKLAVRCAGASGAAGGRNCAECESPRRVQPRRHTIRSERFSADPSFLQDIEVGSVDRACEGPGRSRGGGMAADRCHVQAVITVSVNSVCST